MWRYMIWHDMWWYHHKSVLTTHNLATHIPPFENDSSMNWTYILVTLSLWFSTTSMWPKFSSQAILALLSFEEFWRYCLSREFFLAKAICSSHRGRGLTEGALTRNHIILASEKLGKVRNHDQHFSSGFDLQVLQVLVKVGRRRRTIAFNTPLQIQIQSILIKSKQIK